MHSTDALLIHIQTAGLLLQHDPVLRSLTTLVADTPVAGSWWAHPQAKLMYALSNTLAEHPDVLVLPLVRGKATFLHRRLWPAVLAVACAHEAWQITTLSDAARDLYETVERHGVLRATGAIPKELARRLLVQSTQVHTALGRHELQLTQWTHWAAQVNSAPPVPVSIGRLHLEEAVQAIGGTHGMLPWHAAKGSP